MISRTAENGILNLYKQTIKYTHQATISANFIIFAFDIDCCGSGGCYYCGCDYDWLFFFYQWISYE